MIGLAKLTKAVTRQRTMLAVAAGLLVAVTLSSGGCSRPRFRLRADKEAWQIVTEKARGPGWNLPPQVVYRTPTSRLSDVTNPDYPAMPPDDPTAHELMHAVDGHRGYRKWHRNGDVPFVDNGAWRAFLPYDEQGRVVLDREAAMQAAWTNSREYQFEVEDLYLSALDVSLQRFQFVSQFAATSSTQYTSDGALRPGGPGVAQSVLRNDTTLMQVTKRTAFGTTALVGLANSFIWQFSGNQSETAFTLLNFNIVQPLIRFGTRVRILEGLTQAERTLLANIRQLDQYRLGFVTSIMTGRATGDSVTRGAGLAGVGSNGVGVTTIAGIGTVGGYYGLLQVQQQIRNQRFNLAGLRDSLAQLQELFETGRIPNPLQVEQSRQALNTAQSSLITNLAGYQTRLDVFKLQLGLPPSLEVVIKDDFLKPFQLIDDPITEAQDRLGDLLEIARDERADPDVESLAKILQKASAFRETADRELALSQRDLQTALDKKQQRLEQLTALMRRPEITGGTIDLHPYKIEELERRLKRLETNVAELTASLQRTWNLVEQLRVELPDLPIQEAGKVTVELLTQLSSQMLELSLNQAGARLETVTLVPVELTDDEALEIARQNRRDWMNARTSLVDNWRQIEFTANALKSGLNVTFAGDLRSVDDRPFNFRDTTGRLQVGVAFDAPLTRLAERNVYRESLINYQRARRSYMLFEDRVSQGLRATLRVVRLNQLNFELRRAAVIVAVKQVDLARERLREPPRANAAAGVSTISPTTARDLVSALSDLLNAQNDFLSVWVNYEALRMGLDFELGTMQLDDRGNWIDPGPIDASRGTSVDFVDHPAGFPNWPDLGIPLPEEIPAGQKN